MTYPLEDKYLPKNRWNISVHFGIPGMTGLRYRHCHRHHRAKIEIPVIRTKSIGPPLWFAWLSTVSRIFSEPCPRMVVYADLNSERRFWCSSSRRSPASAEQSKRQTHGCFSGNPGGRNRKKSPFIISRAEPHIRSVRQERGSSSNVPRRDDSYKSDLSQQRSAPVPHRVMQSSWRGEPPTEFF